jgi:hypothetical protein
MRGCWSIDRDRSCGHRRCGHLQLTIDSTQPPHASAHTQPTNDATSHDHARTHARHHATLPVQTHAHTTGATAHDGQDDGRDATCWRSATAVADQVATFSTATAAPAVISHDTICRLRIPTTVACRCGGHIALLQRLDARSSAATAAIHSVLRADACCATGTALKPLLFSSKSVSKVRAVLHHGHAPSESASLFRLPELALSQLFQVKQSSNIAADLLQPGVRSIAFVYVTEKELEWAEQRTAFVQR